MCFTAFVLCSLRLYKLKRDGQTIYMQTENLNANLQDSNRNWRLSGLFKLVKLTHGLVAPLLSLAYLYIYNKDNIT